MGPRSFEASDRDRFVGRSSEIAQLVSLVISNRIVVLYSASGAGKSSLLRAGVGPRLTDHGFDVLPPARFTGDASTTANENPFVAALIGHLEPSDGARQAVPGTLRDYLATRPRPSTSDGPALRVLIVDQFEELFLLHEDRWADRAATFDEFGAALDADPLLRLVIAMREEYLAQFELHVPTISTFSRSRFHLERLRRDQALLAAKEPLVGTGVSFGADVAEALVDELLRIRLETGEERREVMGEFVEPVQLQVVLRRLWLTLPSGVAEIAADHVANLGGISEVLGAYYDEGVAAASDTAGMDELELRRRLQDALVTPNELRGTAQRGPRTTAGIPNAALAVLEDRHLVRAELRAGSTWYELSHDRLIEPILASNSRVGAAHADAAVQEQLRSANTQREQAEARAQKWKRRGVVLGAALFAVVCLALVVTIAMYRDATDDRDVAESRAFAGEAIDSLTARPSAAADVALRAWDLRETAEAEEAVRKSGASSTTAILRPETGGQDPATTWALSADGRRAAMSGDGGWLWDLRQGGPPRELWDAGEENDPAAQSGVIAFSPSGDWLVAEGPDGRLWRWDLRTEDAPAKFGRSGPCEGESGLLLQALLGEASRCLVVADSGSVGVVHGVETEREVTVDLWGPDGQRTERWHLPVLPDGFGSVVLSSDLEAVTYRGNHLFGPGTMDTFLLMPAGETRLVSHLTSETLSDDTISSDGRIAVTSLGAVARIVDLRSRATIVRINGEGDCSLATISSDGRRAAAFTSCKGTEAVVWDVAQPGAPKRIRTPSGDSYRGLRLSPDGSRLLLLGQKNYAVRDVAGGRWIEAPSGTGVLDPLPTRTGGRMLETRAGGDGHASARVIDLPTSSEVTETNRIALVSIGLVETTAVRRTPHGGFVVRRATSGSQQPLLTVPGKRSPDQVDKDLPINRTALSDDGTTVVVTGKERTRVWRVGRTTDRRPRLLQGAESATPGPRGRLVAIDRSRDRATGLFDIDSGDVVVRPDPDIGYGDQEFSPDGRRFATFTEGGELVVFDLTSRPATRKTFVAPRDGSDIEFSPDGTRVAVAAKGDGSVRVWDLASGKTSTVTTRQGESLQVNWSPAGTLAVWGGRDGSVHLHRFETGTKTISLLGHTAAVNWATFSPDGRLVITGSRDGTARVWDASTGANISVLRGSGASVTQVGFDAQTGDAVTLDEEQSLRVWPAAWWTVDIDRLVPKMKARFPEKPVD